jgi:sporulation protein YlmC with PRC-barrel domain
MEGGCGFPKALKENISISDIGDGLMMEEASELIGLQVYTPNGVFLGNVNNLVIDLENKKVDGLFVSETNPLLVEDSKAVNVPFRWIQAVGDIVLLKYFPKRVTTRKGAAPAASKK